MLKLSAKKGKKSWMRAGHLVIYLFCVSIRNDLSLKGTGVAFAHAAVGVESLPFLPSPPLTHSA